MGVKELAASRSPVASDAARGPGWCSLLGVGVNRVTGRGPKPLFAAVGGLDRRQRAKRRPRGRPFGRSSGNDAAMVVRPLRRRRARSAGYSVVLFAVTMGHADPQVGTSTSRIHDGHSMAGMFVARDGPSVLSVMWELIFSCLSWCWFLARSALSVRQSDFTCPHFFVHAVVVRGHDLDVRFPRRRPGMGQWA